MGQPIVGFRGGGGSRQGPSMCDIVHFGRPMSRLCRNKRRHARDNARFVVVGSVSGSSVVVVVVFLGQNTKDIGTHKGCGIRMLIVAGRCFGRLNGVEQLVKSSTDSSFGNPYQYNRSFTASAVPPKALYNSTTSLVLLSWLLR